MSLFDAEPAAAPVRTVSLVKLSSEIAKALAVVGRVMVEGEVHRPTRGSTGAVYFTLKDRAAQISVWCPSARAARCRAVAGERVSVVGAIEYGADRGELKLRADEVTPVGAGAVAAAIAEARRRLGADGLLDRARRPVPRLPRLVGVVCGADAAVRRDIEAVVADRFPGYPVRFLETTVSGPGAAESIQRALGVLAGTAWVDVIVLARGGGDATQLLPFSDEGVCRTVAACPVPVVSAIGHDGDRPLCDEVADLRCGTPSIAAARVIPSRVELVRALDDALANATAALEWRLDRAAGALAAVSREATLAVALASAESRLERAVHAVALRHPGARVERAADRLAAARSHVEALSPARVLERGYAVVRAQGSVVRDPAAVAAGDALEIEVAGGRIGAVVDG